MIKYKLINLLPFIIDGVFVECITVDFEANTALNTQGFCSINPIHKGLYTNPLTS